MNQAIQARGQDGTSGTIAPSGPVWLATLFLGSLLVPYYISVGSLLLMPHRIVLIFAFAPCAVGIFVTRRAGPVLAVDWLVLGSALWACLALAVHHPMSIAVEPMGIHLVEFLGAYLLARRSIRSSADFTKVVRVLFVMTLVLLPLAAVESISKQPILNLLPGNSVPAVDIGERYGLRRAQVIFPHPILFGAFVSTGLGLFWYGLRSPAARLASLPVVVLATVFSMSTGALMSLVVQTIFILWEKIMKVLRWRWRLFAVLFAMLYVAVDLVSSRSPFHVIVNYATFSTGSAYNRILIWQFGTQNVWANPWFGIGLNDWERPRWMGNSVDNFWLLIAMRYGLPAIVMLLLALFLLFRRLSRLPMSDLRDQAARAAFLTSFGGVFVAGGTVHYWHAIMAFVMFLIGSGTWALADGLARPAADTSEDADAGAQSRSADGPRRRHSRFPLNPRGDALPASPLRARPASTTPPRSRQDRR